MVQAMKALTKALGFKGVIGHSAKNLRHKSRSIQSSH